MEQTVTLEWSDLAKAWIAEHGSLAKMNIYDLRGLNTELFDPEPGTEAK